jgi:hypothetical protein
MMTGPKYIKSIVNLLDVVRIVLVYITLFIQHNHSSLHISAVTLFLMWLKLLNFMEVLGPTRYMLQMLYDIMWDIKAFLVILLLGFLGVTIIFHNYHKEDTVYHRVAQSYELAYGNFDFV